MNVLVFGASGATGREVVKQALDRGYSVRAFVRDAGKLGTGHADLHPVVGDVTDQVAVEGAVGGADAVVSALGSGNSLSPHPELIEGIDNVVRAMERAGVRRLVYQSMLGVGGSGGQLGLVDRCIVLPLLLRNVGKDHARKEALIRQSSLDWVIVRPPRLTNGPHTGTWRSGDDILAGAPSTSISRADVADFMVRQCTFDQYVHRSPALLA